MFAEWKDADVEREKQSDEAAADDDEEDEDEINGSTVSLMNEMRSWKWGAGRC